MTSRSEQIKFHIQSDDYFATLATILDLARQTLLMELTEKNSQIKKALARNDRQLGKIRDELMFLQSNYKMIKK